MTGNFWSMDMDVLLGKLDSTGEGLSSEEAQRRLEQSGPNIVEEKSERSALKIFLNQLNSPIMFILLAATMISFFTSDITDGIIILVIIFLSAFISFMQEYRASIDIKNH